MGDCEDDLHQRAVAGSLGRSAEALPKYEAALAMKQRLFKADHPDVMTSLNNVAVCLQILGRSADALPKHEAVLAMRRRLFEGDPAARRRCSSSSRRWTCSAASCRPVIRTRCFHRSA